MVLKAAEQGLPEAQFMVAIWYYYGISPAQDFDKAFEWWEKSAEQDYAMSQLNLGACYQYGEGTAVDIEKAVEWYQKAADQGLEDASAALKALGR